MKKTIYDLKLHETLKVVCEIIGDDGHETYYITRVANGWLYRNVYVTNTTVFVPFDKEWDPADG